MTLPNPEMALPNPKVALTILPPRPKKEGNREVALHQTALLDKGTKMGVSGRSGQKTPAEGF